ncbi:uncharacterized protein N7515_004119 [Penicillium bovifimosum]|uniref:Uncharacterized protein n=1 Tax=Penicillium bovifimosum TaxID=126998 RepID=A0A9W9H6D6_9EURO|nr:uncharacterized protein N7515_004119 [Penicillium bovifimosum]KAJ5139271.1 hypothetical protein N7515_004119 [Penicillium bovifimosum]
MQGMQRSRVRQRRVENTLTTRGKVNISAIESVAQVQSPTSQKNFFEKAGGEHGPSPPPTSDRNLHLR